MGALVRLVFVTGVGVSDRPPGGFQTIQNSTTWSGYTEVLSPVYVRSNTAYATIICQ
jgi:hypothetical protein